MLATRIAQALGLAIALVAALGVGVGYAAEVSEGPGKLTLDRWLYGRLPWIAVLGLVCGLISAMVVTSEVKNRDGVDINSATRRRFALHLALLAVVFVAALFLDLLLISGSQFNPYGLGLLEALAILLDWRSFVLLLVAELLAGASGIAYVRCGKGGGHAARYAFSPMSRR